MPKNEIGGDRDQCCRRDVERKYQEPGALGLFLGMRSDRLGVQQDTVAGDILDKVLDLFDDPRQTVEHVNDYVETFTQLRLGTAIVAHPAFD